MYINSVELMNMLADMVKDTCEEWEAALDDHDMAATEKCRASVKALQEVMNKVLEMDKEEI